MPRPAVFLDRDGTLIEEAGYLDRLGRLIFFPYTVDAVRQLNRAGFVVAVVTNQAGVARGIVSADFIELAHQHIVQRLALGGARVDGFYVCPHHVNGIVPALSIACDCRKPLPGLWKQAAAALDIDFAASFTVGDRWTDIEAGHAVGTRTVLVRTGYGAEQAEAGSTRVQASAIRDDLAAATAWILEQQP